MPLPRFEYVAAQSIVEACAMLAEHGERARVMAGGTDLLIQMRRAPSRSPRVLIALRRVPGLDAIEVDDQGLVLGALARLATVAAHPDVRGSFPALARAAGATATVQIRNMGTVVGNLCNASPAADTAGPLLAHDAELQLVAHGGRSRTLPLEEFFVGPGRTCLAPSELVERVRVPLPAPATGSDYQRLSARSAVDIAAVTVATLVRLAPDGTCAKVRIALGAVAPTPMRARTAEAMLEGRAVTPERITLAAAEAARSARPISDVRAHAAYRRHIVEVLTARSLRHSALAATRTKP